MNLCPPLLEFTVESSSLDGFTGSIHQSGREYGYAFGRQSVTIRIIIQSRASLVVGMEVYYHINESSDMFVITSSLPITLRPALCWIEYSNM